MYNSDSGIKSMIFNKKNIFCDFFQFSRNYRVRKKISMSNFSELFFLNKKNTQLGPGKCQEDQSHKVIASLEQPPDSHTRLPIRGGTLCPPPMQNRVKRSTYSRVPNKRGTMFINFRNFVQGLRPYLGEVKYY